MKKTVQTAVMIVLLLSLFPVGIGTFAAADAGGVTTEECWMERDGQKIFGKLYLPEDAVFPLPLAILSHGLGSDHRIMEPYAERFAESGIAACVFDYIGGSEESLSDGSMTEMSVLTEAQDLNCILDRFRGDGRFSENEIFLFGGSQGGFISAYVAGNRPEDAAGLILLYPAFNLQEICRNLVSDSGEIPDTAVIGEHTVGGVYVRDMLGFDIYEVLSRYTGPTLLFHGTEDPYVPMEYARRAADALADAELVIVEGAGHDFEGEDMERVADAAAVFIHHILAQAVQSMQTAA